MSLLITDQFVLECYTVVTADQDACWVVQVLEDENNSWVCFVCKRLDAVDEKACGTAAASAASSVDDVTALRVRADWDPRSTTVRTLEVEQETDEERVDDSYSESDDDDDYDDGSTGAAAQSRRSKKLKRTGTTPKKSVVARPRKSIATVDRTRTHTRPIALFEISFHNGEEAEVFARDAGLEHWSIDAALVSAAPRKRYFFSQKRPSVPLQPSTTLPLTVKEFLIRYEGEDGYVARKWHSQDARQRFSTVTTKQMLDIYKRFVDKANDTVGLVDIKSRICTSEAPCWICEKRQAQKQELERLRAMEPPTNSEDVSQQLEREIKALEKQVRRECGNRKSQSTWLKKIKEGNFLWGKTQSSISPVAVHTTVTLCLS